MGGSQVVRVAEIKYETHFEHVLKQYVSLLLNPCIFFNPTDSEMVGDSSEVTDMTGKEVIDLASGKKEAGGIATSNADKNSLPIPNMDGYLSTVTVLIIRGPSMAITSMAPCG